MAPRAIWHGHLRLALVSCPVALFNARHDRGGLRFHLINPETGNRIKMITQDSVTGKPLDRSDLVKGYEFAKNKYIILTDDDFKSVKVESSDIMTVDKFVQVGDIDPIYYEFVLLSRARWQSGRRCLCGAARGDHPNRKGRSLPGGHFPARANDRLAPHRWRAHGPHALRTSRYQRGGGRVR